ncbi:MAG: isoprenyl transferase [Chlorobiaceae bacterium]|nr:isoprenyl transferase [Chlorobiaceae bacterium]
MTLIKKMTRSSTFNPHWFSSDNTSVDKNIQAELKSSCSLPLHIAVIMDGNGRWARSKGKTRIEGHVAGVDSVRDVVEACSQLGIKFLTLFTFSTENWKRPKNEITALMRLLVNVIGRESRKLHENDIRLNVIGEIDILPDKVRSTLKETMELTRNNNKLVLNIALSYSGQWDIVHACKAIALDIQSGRLKPEDVNEQIVSSYLSTASMPDPELLIRTSGEFRISNFMLWQSAYSEIYFTNTYWPDFRRSQLYDAILEFQSRERRFGQTSEQIQKNNIAARKL